MTCTDSLHHLYPGACPTCNPREYEAQLAGAPEGQIASVQPEAEPGQMSGGYSDVY